MQLTADSMSDSRLVELAISGEGSAFDALVRRYQRAAYAVAFAVLSDRESAQDVLQESFISAYNRLGDLHDSSKFGAWVCGIARNQAKQFRRSWGRTRSRELPLPSDELSGNTVHADANIERVREAIGMLSESQADVVTLFYMEGYSILECTALLEVPQGTVKRRLHDARQRLRKEMADMVKQHLREFALSEDHRVVIEKTTPIHSTRPVLVWFRDKWVLLWQDGIYWEPYDGPFWFWISESEDGKKWSEPRKLELPEGDDVMRRNPDYLSLMDACVAGDRLVFITQQFYGHFDMYSSEDTLTWTVHPRIRMGQVGRPSIFSSGDDLYLIYPSIFMPGGGNRVDMMRSTDGGFSWRWLNSPYLGYGHIFDVAGAVSDGKIHVAWREVLGKWVPTGEVSGVVHWHKPVEVAQDPDLPEGTISQRVWTGHSDDWGVTWNHKVCDPEYYPDGSGLPPANLQPGKSKPALVEGLDILKPFYSNSLHMAAHGNTLALVQEVRRGEASEEAWVVFSRDGGKTWNEKAVYKNGALGEPAIAFAPDGHLMLAGSSRTKDETRAWVVHSRVEG